MSTKILTTKWLKFEYVQILNQPPKKKKKKKHTILVVYGFNQFA